MKRPGHIIALFLALLLAGYPPLALACVTACAVNEVASPNRTALPCHEEAEEVPAAKHPMPCCLMTQCAKCLTVASLPALPVSSLKPAMLLYRFAPDVDAPAQHRAYGFDHPPKPIG